MKERGIIFSAPMVRAILDGRKTQTRRLAKPQPPHSCRYVMNGAGSHALCLGPNDECVPPTSKSIDHRLPCPYGVPGDRLWVRERWGWFDQFVQHDAPPTGPIVYGTDGVPAGSHGTYWRPSIHMPRWASRITLEVVDVRVERLNEISAKDAVREGLERHDDHPTSITWRHYGDEEPPDPIDLWEGWLNPINSFRTLWDSINGKRHPWSSNPWVWVIEFRKVEAHDVSWPSAGSNVRSPTIDRFAREVLA